MERLRANNLTLKKCLKEISEWMRTLPQGMPESISRALVTENEAAVVRYLQEIKKARSEEEGIELARPGPGRMGGFVVKVKP